jgi:hypothetical protein
MLDDSLIKDLKLNSLLYCGAILIIGGATIHYPAIFAEKSNQAAIQQKADAKTEWACAAIEAKHPLLVDEGGVPITLRDGASYFGASRLGSDMNPLPAGTILRDATGSTGTMSRSAEGAIVFKFVGSCPSLAGTPGVTTMGTYFEGTK